VGLEAHGGKRAPSGGLGEAQSDPQWEVLRVGRAVAKRHDDKTDTSRMEMKAAMTERPDMTTSARRGVKLELCFLFNYPPVSFADSPL